MQGNIDCSRRVLLSPSHLPKAHHGNSQVPVPARAGFIRESPQAFPYLRPSRQVGVPNDDERPGAGERGIVGSSGAQARRRPGAGEGDGLQREQGTRARRRGARAAEGSTVDPPIRRASAARSPRAPRRARPAAAKPPLGRNPTNGRSTACAPTASGQRADDQPGRAGRRQPELAEGRACAARRCSRTSSSARRSPTSTTSASPSASSTRAARPRTATSSATSRIARLTRASLFAEAGKRTPVFVRFSTVAGERGSADTRARRARLRGQVLHRRGQLGPGRQQHSGVLHPGRDEVSRPGPRRQARAAPRDAAGGERARHLLGLRVADARIDAHADVGHVGPRRAAQLPDDAGLRRAHLPARQRRRRVAFREVPLDARSPAPTRSTGTRR